MKKKKIFAALCILLCLFLCACAEGGADDEATPPAQNACAVYMGDAQSIPENVYDYAAWGALVAKARETAENADALILGGDMVNEDTDDKEWAAFFENGGKAGDVFEAIVPAAGNHASDKADLCERFGIETQSEIDGLFYVFETGNIRFLMLDSMTMGSRDEKVVAAVSKWLEAALSDCPDGMWKIAVQHHPLYPAAGSFKDEQRADTMKTNYLPILQKYGVSAVLCGHEHVNTRSEHDGLLQIIGVSGPKRYAVTDETKFDFVYTDGPTYTVITADESTLTFETHGADGEPLDRAEITR